VLTHLGIKNFTTVEQLELELNAGLTTITGETGAGKSVLLDALGLALGDRCHARTLRDEQYNAEISATFQLDRQSDSADWLTRRELLDSAQDEVILRRVITPNGRSRAYINGSAATVGDLKQLGEQLVDLHNQHEHQSLLDKRQHRALLDDVSDKPALLQSVRRYAGQWQQTAQQIAQHEAADSDQTAQLQLLRYQLQELDTLALGEGECAALEAEQRQLAHAEQLLSSLEQAATYCEDDQSGGALTSLQRALQLLQPQQAHLEALQPALELLDGASIQLQEALAELRHLLEQLTVDPQRLDAVEQRLDAIYTIARKHHSSSEKLPQKTTQLRAQLQALENSDQCVEQLRETLQQQQQDYLTAAKQLSRVRNKTAKKLAQHVNQQLQALQMANCQFSVSLAARDSESPHVEGLESVELMISTVPGKAPQPLTQIASGGELSRISLAIQVVAAQHANIPTLVFDEVDVGISGGVTEVVGNLLRQLGESGQVLCVTHQAQVAARGHQHLLVSKVVDDHSAATSIDALDSASRREELARIMGGLDVTASTRAHAEELLASA